MREPVDTNRRSLLRRLVHPIEGGPDRFGSERSFSPPLGGRVGDAERPRGYHIDFSGKPTSASWPPRWLGAVDRQLHVATVQWALGAFERYLAGEGEEWRAAAIAAADHLIEQQIPDGPREGALLQWMPMPHTYRIDTPWASSIAQGEAASLMVRLHVETGEERFADAARRALVPMRTPTRRGGLMAEIDGLPFFEEYPTQPASLVLNGGIFALWGFHDVAAGLDDAEASEWFRAGAEALSGMLDRWDLGYWSRYDLYPHPLDNVASPAYHLLHINQLAVMERLTGEPRFGAVRRRFEAYRESPSNRRRANIRKVAFRLLTPRNALLAHRLPWNNRVRRRNGGEDLVVLCYHAVSDTWRSSLAVTPDQLREQLGVMLDAGFRPTTFSEGVLGPRPTRSFAVTFDDAYDSIAQRAKPVLDELGVPGTVFVPTAFAGGSEPLSWPGVPELSAGSERRELAALGWDDLRRLAEEGWEIGSHTHSHPRLTELDDEHVAAELRRSRAECERRLGRPCLSLAYPYGDQDHRVIKLAAEAGYATAAALPPPFSAETLLAWPRIGVYSVDRPWRLRLKISKPMRRLRSSRLGPLLKRIATGRPHRPGKPS